MRNTYGVAAVLLLVFGSPLAHAFSPIGGYDSFDVRRYRTWAFSEFDTNNDGSVDADEGLGMLLEGGPRGFTTEELAIVEEALQVWEDVSTSYASFRTEGISQDILPTGIEPDGIPTIAMEVTTVDEDEDTEPDPADVTVGVGNGVLGVTITLFTIDDTQVEVGGNIVTLPAGTIIDSDIVIDATSHRRLTPDTEPLADLKGTMVHELGHLLGLGHTALNNLREVIDQDTGTIELVESEPLALTGSDGIQRRIGATPTMYPFLFSVDDLDDEDEGLRDGASDLALDDISAISWLYPRGSQANYFAVNSEARTRVRENSNLPSAPIVGGHVVAWADADNLDATERVPVFSTLTGYYERIQNPELWGQFELLGMWKQLELVGAPNQLFTPTYTFTISPLSQTGAQRQSPLGIIPEDVDYLLGPGSSSANLRGADEYSTTFPSEVFQEVNNIVDVSNKDAGTPMQWDFESNTIVSADTGRTLSTILNGRAPMFGDPNDVCPLNIIQSPAADGGTGTGDTGGGGLKVAGTMWNGPDNLRGLRDHYLLPSVLGTVLVDAYYTMAPDFARFLLDHPMAFSAWRSVAGVLYWTLENPMKVFFALSGMLIAVGALRYRRRRAVAAGLMMLLVAGLSALPAHATIEYLTTDDMVDRVDCIVTGRVLATSGRWGVGGRIYTDVTLRVDTAEGCDLVSSKQTEGEAEGEGAAEGESDPDITETITLSVLGGQVDKVAMHASSMPQFRVGEEVLLYLKEVDGDWIVYAGQRGKFNILTVKATGEKYIDAANPYTERSVKEDLQSQPMRTDGKGRVYLPDYIDYIRLLKGE